jgi:alpha-galactosidase
LRLARESFPFQVFQVDDGFQKDIGDWLDPKEGFVGLPELAEAIAGRGFEPGIWTAPFSAAESSSLFKCHADWMVRQDGRPKVAYKNWGKRIYALDCTRPEALVWLGKTFSSLRLMGFTYFKVDFLFAAAIPGERMGQGTPIEAFRKGMAAIRRATGDAFLLGCGAPLLPSAGLVEGMRIGEDTAPFWDAKRGAFEGPNAFYALKNSILRSFLHRRLWLNDPDCLLLRSRDISLTANEKELYALTVGALDNMIIESDDLGLVDEWGRELLRKAIALQGGRARAWGLMDDDFYRIEARGGDSGHVLVLANLSENEQSYLSAAVPARSVRVIPVTDGKAGPLPL